jgi:hypothetical protein
MNSPDPALVDYIQRRIQRTRHRDAERHTLARREASRIRAHAYARSVDAGLSAFMADAVAETLRRIDAMCDEPDR